MSELQSRSSDFVVFVCFEGRKWERRGGFKENLDSFLLFIHDHEEQNKRIR